MEKDKEKEIILEDFFSKLYNSQMDMPPEFAEIVNEYFWEMLDSEDEKKCTKI